MSNNTSSKKHYQYYLITAAYNTEKTIVSTIASVLNQTIHPSQWIIINDGSSDSTANVIKRAVKNNKWIKVITRIRSNVQTHSFSSKVGALNLAISCININECEYIGVLDADIELPCDYYEVLLGRMRMSNNIGVAGGFIRPFYNNSFHDRVQGTCFSVAGAVQMFNAQCFVEIGGSFLDCPFGGEDAAMEIIARSKGWSVITYSDLTVTHYGRVGAAAGSYLKYRFRKGASYASIGYGCFFQIIRCVIRAREYPWIIGSMYELSGYIYFRVRCRKQILDEEVIKFLRKEQNERLLCTRSK